MGRLLEKKFLSVNTTLKGVSIIDFRYVNEAQQHRSKRMHGFSIRFKRVYTIDASNLKNRQNIWLTVFYD